MFFQTSPSHSGTKSLSLEPLLYMWWSFPTFWHFSTCLMITCKISRLFQLYQHICIILQFLHFKHLQIYGDIEAKYKIFHYHHHFHAIDQIKWNFLCQFLEWEYAHPNWPITPWLTNIIESYWIFPFSH